MYEASFHYRPCQDFSLAVTPAMSLAVFLTPLGLAKDRLPVVVSFMSPKPMSFTANIDFMDEDGKRFSMSVTGTTDNSLLSHGAFMAVNKSQLVFSHEPGMPVFLEEAAYVLPPPHMCLGPDTPCRGVAHYLNATTTRGPFDNLGHQMMVSRGKLLLEIVEMLSGKSVPGRVRVGRGCLFVTPGGRREHREGGTWRRGGRRGGRRGLYKRRTHDA